MSALHEVDYQDTWSLKVWFDKIIDEWEQTDVSYDDRYKQLLNAIEHYLGYV